ncbi:Eco57I restriction-modification methylase domain-containing protein [Persephonella sp.]
MQTKELVEEIFANPENINEIFIEYFEEKNYSFQPKEEIIPIEKHSDKFEEPLLIGELDLDDGNKLDFYTIKVKENLTEKSSKRQQYEIARDLLKLNSTDAGIFIFYDNDGNFRLSFVHAEYKGTKRDFSHYKRYTYYVSKDQPNRTFLKQLDEADFTTIEKIKKAFSLKQLTKEFYNEIQNWYAWALKQLNEGKASFPGGKNEENLIRLITRIIFVWFLKERKLLPEEIFDEDSLRNIVKDFKTGDNYYNVILQNLFFATLNRYPEDRKFAIEGNFSENREHFGVKTLYRYAKKLLISKEEFIKLLEPVPFINGGLFECLDRDKDYIDGFSRNDKKRAKLPDHLFYSDEVDTDLTFFYGSSKKTKVKGLINILKEYNFTADESSPIDVEVSLDPELLGHIFENLLAAYNPETSKTARKETGSYYTPKEIVEFMVDESLIHYFKNKTGIEEEKLRELLSYDEKKQPLSDEEKQKVITAIDELKIIDPAVGSGAFPMGILHKLVHILHKLDPENKLWKEKQLRRIEKAKKEILQIQDIKRRNDLLEGLEKEKEELEKAFENELDYSRKLFLIENSIYGVDIQPIAIQIAKLRFFLSLLIDQKIDKDRENYGILPLPNLETKFVAANTLIGLDKSKQGLLFKTPKIIQLEEEYKDLMRNYFSASNRGQKKRIQEKAKKIREELKNELKNIGMSYETTEKIANFDIFDQLSSADWFDPEWMFGVDDGFDIVIGNPPYVRQENIKSIKPILKKQYKIFTSTADLYSYFYEKAYQILSERGIYSFITSNKFMRAKYGKELREFLKNNTKLKNIIDFGGYQVFETATVDTVIVIGEKDKSNGNNIHVCLIEDDFNEETNIYDYCKEKGFEFPQEKLLPEVWTFEDLDIKEKIEKIGTPLKDWDVNINYGIKTGFNEAFIIDEKTRQKILNNCKSEEEIKRTEEIIKPILRGRDIKRYYYKWAGLYLIATFPSLNLNIDDYPALKEYLKSFGKKLEQTGQTYIDPKTGKKVKTRKKTANKWFETQDNIAYWKEFEKEKIVWQRVTLEPQFCISPEGMYILDSMAFLVSKNNTNLKYLLAILNSKAIYYYLDMIGHQYGNTGYLLSNQYVERFPIPKIPEDQQKPFIELVDKILELANREDYEHRPELQQKVQEYSDQIDQLIYKLYNLTDEEIKRIDRKIKS